MEIEVSQEKLAKALNIVSRITPTTRTTLPILNNVMIRADKKKITLTSTNLELASVCFVPGKVVRDGVITVPARLLADFVSNLPKGELVKISVDGMKLVTQSGKYQSSLNGVSADEFPELPSVGDKVVKLSIPVEIFTKSISNVVMAASNDTTRPILTGVYFNNYEGKLYVAATDGYRLAEREMVDFKDGELAIVVPVNSLNEVIRGVSDEIVDIEVEIDEDLVKFVVGEVEITSKLISGSFPDYRQLIPKKSEVKFLVGRDELVRVVKLSALFARESGGSIMFETKDNSLFISAVANEFGENTSEIEIGEVEVGKITLNSKFLIDALGAIESDKVSIGFSGKLAPMVVRNEKNNEYTHIIMPLKV